MNIWGLLFLIITQLLCGRGVIGMFKIQLKLLPLFCLSMMTGIVLVSFLPVLLEVFHIPINALSVSLAIIFLTILLNITQVSSYDYSVFRRIKIKMPPAYEAVFIVLFILLLLPAIWKSFYYPPYARDVLSGPEALAEYAVREGTIINSVFSIDLSGTNNHLKPPLVMDLQIIYKLLVYPFGKLWLIMMALSFVTWLYTILKEHLHPLVAGLVMLFYITIPDMYGYMYVLLFDYCNIIFFFAGFYFLAQYAQTNLYKHFTFSVFLFTLATYIRLETIVLLGLSVPLIIYLFRKNKMPIPKIAVSLAMLHAFSYLVYFLWIHGFIKHYMPVSYDVSNDLNLSFNGAVSAYLQKLSIMTSGLVFGSIFATIYGYYIYFFVIILAIDILFFRNTTFNVSETRIALYAILLVYFAMPFLSYLIPLFDMSNTVKRGLAKMLPLIILYFRNSGILLKLSALLLSYEKGMHQAKEIPGTVYATAKTKSKKKKKQP